MRALLVSSLCGLACSSQGSDEESSTSGTAGAASHPTANGSSGTGDGAVASSADGAASEAATRAEGTLIPAAGGQSRDENTGTSPAGGAADDTTTDAGRGGSASIVTTTEPDAGPVGTGARADPSGGAGAPQTLSEAGRRDRDGVGSTTNPVSVAQAGTSAGATEHGGAAGRGSSDDSANVGGLAGLGGGRAGSAGEAGEAGADGGTGPAIVEGQVWTDTSVALSITHWGAFGGIEWTFEATREELTAKQISELEHLQLIEPPDVDVTCDVDYYALDITAADGTRDRQTVIDPECWTKPVVTYASFRPFLESLGCGYYVYSFNEDQSYAGLLAPSPCSYSNQLLPQDDYQPLYPWARLAIPAASRCTLSFAGAHMQVSLFAPDSETLLTTTEVLDVDGTGTSLEYDYPDAGEYWLRLEHLEREPDRFRWEFRCDT